MSVTDAVEGATESIEHQHIPFEELDIPEIEGAREADVVRIFFPPVSLVNTFSQHRQGRNERQADLNASIEADAGRLHYQVDLGSVSQATALEILDFTNRVWGGSKTLDDLVPYKPGMYLVLIAGHSRKEGVEAYAHKTGQALNDTPIKSQLHDIETVDDFLTLQLKENIHSAPPPERTARGYAEAFLWAKVHDPKLTRTAFCRTNGIRANELRESLLYADLPPYIRELQDTGSIPWSVTMELARAFPWVVKDVENKLLSEGDVSDVNIELAGQQVKDTMLWLMVNFSGKFKGHIKPTKAFIRSHVAAIRAQFENKPDKDEAGEYAMTLFDAREIVDSKQKLRQNLGELASTRAVMVRDVHNAVAAVAGHEELEIDAQLEDQVIDLGRDVEEAASVALRRLIRSAG